MFATLEAQLAFRLRPAVFIIHQSAALELLSRILKHRSELENFAKAEARWG
jgi:hypothetical protein